MKETSRALPERMVPNAEDDRGAAAEFAARATTRIDVVGFGDDPCPQYLPECRDHSAVDGGSMGYGPPISAGVAVGWERQSRRVSHPDQRREVFSRTAVLGCVVVGGARPGVGGRCHPPRRSGRCVGGECLVPE